ncbi:MAG TPA: Spo0E family sporulation regulatory protein-aspartic acid phosphatase [Bacillota bacterium]
MSRDSEIQLAIYRDVLKKSVKRYGLSSPRVLRISRRVDRFIVALLRESTGENNQKK